MEPVLTADEVEALSSDAGRALLLDAARLTGDLRTVDPDEPAELAAHSSSGRARLAPLGLLAGCFVGRRAAAPRDGQPLYSPARIRAHRFAPRGAAAASPPRPQLLLAVLDDHGEWRDEDSWTSLCRIANDPADAVYDAAAASGPAARIVCALSAGQGEDRLRQLEAAVRSGRTEAERRWRELVSAAELAEDETTADRVHPLLRVGDDVSPHERLFSSLAAAPNKAPLMAFLQAVPEDEYDGFLTFLCEVFTEDEWPSKRRVVAEEWVRWLLSRDAKRRGYVELLELVDRESGLAPEEHAERDEAWRFGFHSAVVELLCPIAGVLADVCAIPRKAHFGGLVGRG